MINTLTLLIPSDWPETRRDCPWRLHDARGQLLAQGCSEPAHWPLPGKRAEGSPEPPGKRSVDGAALRCNVILCGQQVSGHRVVLPKTALGRRPEVIAAALEDSLLDAGELLQFAVPPAPVVAGEATTVAVVAQSRLMRIGQTLEALGLPLSRAWPLSFCLGAAPAALVADELTLNLPAGGFVSLPADNQLSAWLASLESEGIKAPLSCAVLDQRGDTGWQATHDATGCLQMIAAFSPLTVPDGAGFLYGELAPARAPSTVRRDLRVAARLALGLVSVTLLLATLQWGWLAWQAERYRQTISDSFRSVSPQGAMVDPLLQMQRQVDTLRHARGQLASGDFLRLMAPLGGLAGNSLNLQTLSYDNGQLRISGQLSNEDWQALVHNCQRLGVKCQLSSAEMLGRGQAITLEISEGS